jgi:3'-phosphoadenosine 5'-phosphosulfate (PAPS) 3'-phosphatase
VRKVFISQDLLNEKHKGRRVFIEKGIGLTYAGDGIELEEFSKFNTKDAVVWVDPLDGTSDFVAGNLPAVTVLIGVSIKGHSRIGIIHNPFSDEDQSKGRTVFGTVEHGAFRLYCDENMGEEELSKRVPEYIEPFNHHEVPAEDHKVIVAASISHFSAEMKTSN